ncbi:acetyl-CoA acetyltransferase [Qipengyuania sediminis]|uniref:acetyl-CoA acetyltransferase n=1 Tax=Qipengyuania sediminis TaxID=1532023 RepID=UPI001059F77F|nr:acetyl-CoA acetyltransferase [Qipengyuania sediminis]
MDAERAPVVVGVGQVNDRPADPAEGLDPIALMAQALRRAESNAGGGWLAACDSLAVVSQIGWPHLNPVAERLARKLGITPSRLEETAKPNGDSPIRLLNEAANRIGAGESTICAIVGGEALRTATALRAQGHDVVRKDAAEGRQETSASLRDPDMAAAPRHDALRDAAHRNRTSYAARHGLVVPVDVYPLYENAGRASRGETLAQAQAESGALWAGMSRVAAECEHAWLRRAVTAEEVVTPSERNRPIAYPYTKLQVANASVNQGAGFLVTSLAEARRRGVAEARLVYVGHGAAASEDEDFLRRDSYAASASLTVSIERCLEMNRVTSADLGLVELYSCFPCIPKLARRVLDWPLEKPITVFGGLTFGGGPIGNYMSHAVACMVERLRAGGGKGLLFANGGYATHNHTILLSAAPLGHAFPQEFDCQAEADARRGPIPPLDEDYTGPARIETWTLHFGRDGSPRLGTIVALTPAGARTLAAVTAADETHKRLLEPGREPVGAQGAIHLGAAGTRCWAFTD